MAFISQWNARPTMVANPQWVSEGFRVALGVSYATS